MTVEKLIRILNTMPNGWEVEIDVGNGDAFTVSQVIQKRLTIHDPIMHKIDQTRESVVLRGKYAHPLVPSYGVLVEE